MRLSAIPRLVMKNRRAILACGSFIFGGLSFAKIWMSRHKIDEVLEETRERRQSEDKQVRREGNIEAFKKIAVIVVLPAIGMIGSMAMSLAAHNIATKEIKHAYDTVESISRVAVQNSFRDAEGNPITIQEVNQAREQQAIARGIPYEKFRLKISGEIFILPRTWRHTGIDDANDEIERIVENSDDRIINLGQIRTAIKPDAEYTGMDDTIIWDCSSIVDTIPSLSVVMPDRTYNDELMWEIVINGFPSIDGDTAICA